MGGIATSPDLADRVRIAGAELGIAADTATSACGPKVSLGALGGQRPFELGDSTEHVQREHALRRGGVDWIAQAAEVRSDHNSSCSMTAGR